MTAYCTRLHVESMAPVCVCVCGVCVCVCVHVCALTQAGCAVRCIEQRKKTVDRRLLRHQTCDDKTTNSLKTCAVIKLQRTDEQAREASVRVTMAQVLQERVTDQVAAWSE